MIYVVISRSNIYCLGAGFESVLDTVGNCRDFVDLVISRSDIYRLGAGFESIFDTVGDCGDFVGAP